VKQKLGAKLRIPFFRGEHVEAVRIPNTDEVLVARGDYSTDRQWLYEIVEGSNMA
jgi:hypothetical protein